MSAQERTRDLYEEIPGYPKPPLVPLPEPGDLESLERLGLKLTPLSRKVVKAAMFVTGFNAFQEQLPDRIEPLLRRHNLRGPATFTPVISATTALEDDPRDLSPVERASTLLFAAYSLYEDLISARFPPDRYRDHVLEMGQYPNLFSTSLIWDGGRARVFKSEVVSRVTVAAYRRFYSLDVEGLRSDTWIDQVKDALTQLIDRAAQNRLRADEPTPGVLTCAMDATQRKAFGQLQKSEINVKSLSTLRHSFLTLCFDLDSHPSSHAEAAFLAHSGHRANRWYHSSLQLVVFGNARACAICNFNAYVDGNVMMRGASEIQRRALACPVESGAKETFVSLPPATELRWEIDGGLIRQAQRDLRSVQDNQQATFEIQGIGERFFTAHGVKPVPGFILALQMTAKRLTGKMVEITQFLAMSKYRCMDLLTAVVTTPEVERFVDYVGGGEAERDRAIALLQTAVRSQERACRNARRHLPLHEMIGLFVASRTGVRRRYVASVVTLTALFLRLVGLLTPKRREIIVSHPVICPEVPILGRPGVRLPYVEYFALHYQIMENRVVITMMPGVDWTIPNAEFIAVLRESLEELQEVIRE